MHGLPIWYILVSGRRALTRQLRPLLCCHREQCDGRVDGGDVPSMRPWPLGRGCRRAMPAVRSGTVLKDWRPLRGRMHIVRKRALSKRERLYDVRTLPSWSTRSGLRRNELERMRSVPAGDKERCRLRRVRVRVYRWGV